MAEVSFTISHEKGVLPPKQFSLKPGANTRIRIGRAPGNDMVVEFRGVSQYHAELRLLPEAQGNCRLSVKDLSMNGTGMKKPDGSAAACLVKGKDEPVPNGSVLLVPMLLKATASDTDRGYLKIELDEKADQDDEENEKNRMQFVELLLKTKEVSAGTTYEDARKLLSSAAAWGAVDEQTRKECFDIFVQHLGDHQSQKKEKKKKDNKEKDGKAKKRKSGRDDAPHEKPEEDPPARRTGNDEPRGRTGNDDARDRSRSRGRDDPERRQKHKKEKKAGDGDGARNRRRRRSNSP